MKTKSIRADSVVTPDFFGIHNVVLSPEIKASKDYENYDFILAHILTARSSFRSQILETRREIGITKPFTYSDIKNTESLYESMFSLGQEEYLQSKAVAKKIAKLYKLPSNWIFSIQVAIYTDTLLVPPKLDSIIIQIGPTREDDEYPSIHFTSQVTIGELKKWVNDNKSDIRLFLKRIPKRPKPKVSSNTLIWGHIAWLFKRGGKHSWTEITNLIQVQIGKLLETADDVYGRQEAPTPIELEKYYTRFTASLKKLR